jgi:hypothetical protein
MKIYQKTLISGRKTGQTRKEPAMAKITFINTQENKPENNNRVFFKVFYKKTLRYSTRPDWAKDVTESDGKYLVKLPANYVTESYDSAMNMAAQLSKNGGEFINLSKFSVSDEDLAAIASVKQKIADLEAELNDRLASDDLKQTDASRYYNMKALISSELHGNR